MLNNLFSKASVLKLEKLIFDGQNILLKKIDRLCDKQLIDICGAMRLDTPRYPWFHLCYSGLRRGRKEDTACVGYHKSILKNLLTLDKR